MGSGAYIGPTHPAWVRTASVDELAAAFVREAREGVSGRRGGGSGRGSSASSAARGRSSRRRRACCEAGARAQRETGLGISIHPGRDRAAPFEIVDRLAAAGADLSRVVIGHLDRTVQDLPGLSSWGASASYLEFDLFGLETSYYPWGGVRAGLVRRAAARPGPRADRRGPGRPDRPRPRHLHQAPAGALRRPRLRPPLSNVMPWMRTLGFTEPEIRLLTVTNPATRAGGRRVTRGAARQPASRGVASSSPARPGGIGRAVCAGFAQAGARVLATDLDQAALDALVAGLRRGARGAGRGPARPRRRTRRWSPRRSTRSAGCTRWSTSPP